MRANYDCSSVQKPMVEEEKAVVPPYYNPASGRVQKMFNINGNYF